MAEMTDMPEPTDHAPEGPNPRPSTPGASDLAGWVRDYAYDLHRFLSKRRLVESDIQDVCQEVYLRLLRFDRMEIANNPPAYLIRVAAYSLPGHAGSPAQYLPRAGRILRGHQTPRQPCRAALEYKTWYTDFF
jgi:Sigma-70 region 2